MRSRFAFAVVAATLLISVAAPAAAATRVRVYKGTTSQDHTVKFFVVKNDRGRSVYQFNIDLSFSCEDGTTQEWGVGYGFGGGRRLTDGVLWEFDEVSPWEAIHFNGRIGHRRGTGTLLWSVPLLTADEQAQLCTTGEQTWQVEYLRTIVRESGGFFRSHAGVTRVRVSEDGEVSRTTTRY